MDLKEALSHKYRHGLKEKLRVKYQTKLEESLKVKYHALLKESLRRKYQTSLKEPLKLKYQTSLKEPLKLKYQTSLKEPLKLKYRASLEEPLKIKYQASLKEPLRIKYQECLREPLRIKYQESIKELSQLRYRVKKSTKTFGELLSEFRRGMCLGLTFECICCERVLFENGVVKLSESAFSRLDKQLIARSINSELLSGPKFLCHCCHRNLQKGELPSMSAQNSLTIESIPEELKLSDFEMQLIAKDLLFMKIFNLPKSRMPAVKDKVINVPLTHTDLEITTKILPRNLDDSLLVNVQFKRCKDFKNVHSEALVRPHMLLKALAWLQSSGNLFYNDVVLNEKFCLDETALFATDEQPEDDQEAAQTKNEDNLDTCLIPQNSAAHVISNYGVVSRVVSETIVVAPGENKLPTNWLANVDFGAKSFPCFFPSGKFTLSDTREVRISSQQYFSQRIMNKNPRFAEDSRYLFAAQQRVEREQLERQCDIFFAKGKQNVWIMTPSK